MSKLNAAGSRKSERASEPVTNSSRVHVIVTIVLGAIGAIPLVFLTPPFQVPDEIQHFYRAYEISEFRIRAQVQNGVAGDAIPNSMIHLSSSLIYSPDGGISYPVSPTPLSKSLSYLSTPLQAGDRAFARFPGAAYYSPLAYLPQALGIVVARSMGLGPLYLLYFGRLFNCLCALMLLAWAVYRIPFGKEIVMLVGLLPMSFYLFASLSADASVISCALLFTAIMISAESRGKWNRPDIVVASIAGAIFCSVKPVYAPLLIAGLIPGLFHRSQVANTLRAHVTILLTALGLTAGWVAITRSAMTLPISGANPPLQIHFILNHPVTFAHTIVHSLTIGNLAFYYVGCIGLLGWADLKLQPHLAYLLPWVSFFLVWLFGPKLKARITIFQSLWYLLLVFLSGLLVMTALYVTWCRVGQGTIEGVQGRYFIPVFALAGIALLRWARGWSPKGGEWLALAGLAAMILLQVAITDLTIIHAFGLFS
jgi:uncharacterized membrane protein